MYAVPKNDQSSEPQNPQQNASAETSSDMPVSSVVAVRRGRAKRSSNRSVPSAVQPLGEPHSYTVTLESSGHSGASTSRVDPSDPGNPLLLQQNVQQNIFNEQTNYENQQYFQQQQNILHEHFHQNLNIRQD